jgi:hypothetical protein
LALNWLLRFQFIDTFQADRALLDIQRGLIATENTLGHGLLPDFQG